MEVDRIDGSGHGKWEVEVSSSGGDEVGNGGERWRLAVGGGDMRWARGWEVEVSGRRWRHDEVGKGGERWRLEVVSERDEVGRGVRDGG